MQINLSGSRIKNQTIESLFSAINSRKKQGLNVCFCGDSITDDSESSGSWVDWGWLCWYKRMIGINTTISPSSVFAISGATTDDLVSNQLPKVLRGSYDICFVMIGTNDGSVIDTKSNLNIFYNELSEAGIFCIALPIYQRDNSDPFSSDGKKIVESANRFMRTRSKNHSDFLFVNTLPDLVDYTTGNAVSGLLRDSVHTNKSGALTLAQSVYDKTSHLFDSEDYNVEVSSLSYDSVLNPHGDMLPNGRMNGTGGSTINSASGVVADNWRLNLTGGTGVTVVGSKGTRTDATGATQIITLGGTASVSRALIDLTATNISVPEGLQTGDKVILEMKVKVANMTNIERMYLRHGFGTSYKYDGATSDSYGPMPTDYELVYSVENYYTEGQVPNCQLYFTTYSTGDVTGTVTIIDTRMYKVK